MSAVAVTRQARSLGRPSTTTRQSKQTPIPQKIPRGRPLKRVLRHERIPAAINAAPTL